MTMTETLEFFTEEYVRRTWGVEIADTTVVRVPARLPSFGYIKPYVPPGLDDDDGWWAKVQRFFGRLFGKEWGKSYRWAAVEYKLGLVQLHLWIPDALGLLHYVIDIGYLEEVNILVLSEFRLI